MRKDKLKISVARPWHEVDVDNQNIAKGLPT